MLHKSLYLNFDFEFLNYFLLFFYFNYIFSIYQKKFYINIILLNQFDMIDINYNFRGIKKVSDILSFNFDLIDIDNYVFGDIYIYDNSIRLKSIFYAISIRSMYFFILTHGVCHLLGCNHHCLKDFQNMRKLENNFLNFLK